MCDTTEGSRRAAWLRAMIFWPAKSALAALSERLLHLATGLADLSAAGVARVRAYTPTERERIALRWVLAGPVAVIVTVLALMGMPLYLPPGAGNIDHLVIPLVLLPIVWAALFFHAILDRNLQRIAVVSTFIALVNVGLLLHHFTH